MRLHIETPTHIRACSTPGCDRVVGPYFDPREADVAMDEHRHIRHRAIRMGDPCPGYEHRKGEPWALHAGV